MPVNVKIEIQGREVASAYITNCGHPVDGTHLTEDDLRLYEYEVTLPTPSTTRSAGSIERRQGCVIHRRGDRVVKLVAKVLEDCGL